MSKKKLQLLVVSQEKKLLDAQVDQVIVPSSSGELTILPDHIPLLRQLSTGELIYKQDNKKASIVISKRFINISQDQTLVVNRRPKRLFVRLKKLCLPLRISENCS